MKITRIKEIQWWDPKVHLAAITYKVWVENNGLTHLVYFNTKEELDKFIALEDKPRNTKSKNNNIK